MWDTSPEEVEEVVDITLNNDPVETPAEVSRGYVKSVLLMAVIRTACIEILSISLMHS